MPIIDLKDDAVTSPRIEDDSQKPDTPVAAEESKPEEPDFPDLTDDQRTFLSECLSKFNESFKVDSEKDSSLK
jgi:hypothetical protein